MGSDTKRRKPIPLADGLCPTFQAGKLELPGPVTGQWTWIHAVSDGWLLADGSKVIRVTMSPDSQAPFSGQSSQFGTWDSAAYIFVGVDAEAKCLYAEDVKKAKILLIHADGSLTDLRDCDYQPDASRNALQVTRHEPPVNAGRERQGFYQLLPSPFGLVFFNRITKSLHTVQENGTLSLHCTMPPCKGFDGLAVDLSFVEGFAVEQLGKDVDGCSVVLYLFSGNSQTNLFQWELPDKIGPYKDGRLRHTGSEELTPAVKGIEHLFGAFERCQLPIVCFPGNLTITPQGILFEGRLDAGLNLFKSGLFKLEDLDGWSEDFAPHYSTDQRCMLLGAELNEPFTGATFGHDPNYASHHMAYNAELGLLMIARHPEMGGKIVLVDLKQDLTKSTFKHDLASLDITSVAGKHVSIIPRLNGNAASASTCFRIDAGLLMRRCKHFAASISSGMAESHSHEITVEGSTEVVEAAVRYLLSDDFEPKRPSSDEECLQSGLLCLGVWNFSEMYGIFRLRELALRGLQRSLQNSNCLRLLQECQQLHCSCLDREPAYSCWKFIKSNWGVIRTAHADQLNEVLLTYPSLAVSILQHVETFIDSSDDDHE
ncbi:unnamed protein product [Polarella glacialis]|uniref:BTB domain-containing protein n=2 Tax=Polarella glacialis TaxID=89957 RepID=A0A813EIE9_POLGL|nr:unnamed protein product [Polarella glacialis]